TALPGHLSQLGPSRQDGLEMVVAGDRGSHAGQGGAEPAPGPAAGVIRRTLQVPLATATNNPPDPHARPPFRRRDSAGDRGRTGLYSAGETPPGRGAA